MRSVVLRYDDLPDLHAAVEDATGQDLALPAGLLVREGEWVLALFELATTPRATAAAGKGVATDDGGMALVFERRDWERLRHFASARTTTSNNEPVAPPPPQPSGMASLRRTLGWEAAPRSNEDPYTTAPEGLPPPVPSEAPVTEEQTYREPKKLAGQGSRILLVDDDADLREVVAAMLETVGLVVDAVESAEEALARVRARAPDLVVLDWNLPGMSGLDFCKVVRGDPLLAAMPLLFLTAHGATQDMVEAFAAGADDYVVKPFRAAELGARIFGLLRRTRGTVLST
ncbi:MAG: response regulator transcription factor [Polyangiales bacterium]